MLHNIFIDMDARGMVMSCAIFKNEAFSLMILNNTHTRRHVPLGCVYKRSQSQTPKGEVDDLQHQRMGLGYHGPTTFTSFDIETILINRASVITS